MKNPFIGIALAVSLVTSSSHATIVEFQTSLGNFKVNLHDQTTPIAVENFLGYVNDGDYDNTIVHRTANNFVIQGGGAVFEGQLPPTWIETRSAITNEPVYSNVTATIAMAKLGGDLNSATSQWFINLKNNSTLLDPIDPQGGGAFTVFGEVIEDGMDVVNSIANVERCDTRKPGFRELPMLNYSDFCGDDSAVPSQENFVTINTVTIYDSTIVTDGNLASVPNTRYQSSTGSGPSIGGGSAHWVILLLAALSFAVRRK